VTDTYEDGYRQGVEMATQYLRGVADCFLDRGDVPASVADVPAFLARIAKNIDDVGAGFAVARAKQNAPRQEGDPLH
jgi:hypothetical protein